MQTKVTLSLEHPHAPEIIQQNQTIKLLFSLMKTDKNKMCLVDNNLAQMTSRIICKNKNTLNLLERFPRSNRNYLPSNNNCKSIVVWGSNLSSTVNYPKFTSIVRYMVDIPFHLQSMLGGLLISDAWLQINKAGNTRFFFKQSLANSAFVLFVFNRLSHYCSSYPIITTANSPK
jgi:hypothetical protein